MHTPTDRYLNPFTDFAFQRLFGSEQNKDLLLDFVNALALTEQKVVSVSFLTAEQDEIKIDAKTIVGALCQTEKGEQFIVQLQKLKQNSFKERSVYYNALSITAQADLEKNWDFNLKTVYSIGLLDFAIDSESKYRHKVQLVDTESQQVFYDKGSFVYLQVPKFNKTVEQLSDRLDKWLFVLKNFTLTDGIPEALKDKTFEKYFDVLDSKKLDNDALKKYEESLKYYRDLKNTLATAKAEGREEGVHTGIELGKQEEKIRVAKQLLKMGADIDMISEITDLKHSEIQALSKEWCWLDEQMGA